MKILVADDHDLFREGISRLALQLDGSAEVLEASDWQVALQIVANEPDLALALVDLNMPEMKAFDGLESLMARAETVAVVVISASENLMDMKRVLDLGAMGYILKSEPTPVILNALRLIMAGGIYIPPRLVQTPSANNVGSASNKPALPFGLTPRQYDVLQVMLQGKSNKEIARELDLSDVTVKAHIGAIFKALNVSTRAQAIIAVGNSND